VTARWAGNAYYLNATVAESTVAEKLATTAAWTAPAPITYGTTLSGVLDATASVAGTFAYKNNGSPVTASTVLAAGAYTLTATFTPSVPNDYAGSSTTATLTVNKVNTTTTITNASASKAAPLVLTVSFTVANGLFTAHPPTGSVTVTDSHSGLSCTGTPASNGKGSCVITFTSAGTASLKAVYAGDSNDNGSTSSAFPYTLP
jgi:hypothetical protein